MKWKKSCLILNFKLSQSSLGLTYTHLSFQKSKLTFRLVAMGAIPYQSTCSNMKNMLNRVWFQHFGLFCFKDTQFPKFGWVFGLIPDIILAFGVFHIRARRFLRSKKMKSRKFSKKFLQWSNNDSKNDIQCIETKQINFLKVHFSKCSTKQIVC